MAKKRIAMFLAMVMTASMFAGCGGSGENKDDASKDPVVEEDKDADSSDTTGDVVLSVFDACAYGLDEYAQMVAQFENDHPGVTVEVQHAPNDTATLLQSRVNSDDIPDVFAVESGTQAKQYYEYAYDWTNDADVLALFNEDAIDSGRDDNGNVMSLPWTYENMGILYNKDCFEAAGITELPTTIDELEDACKKLDAAGITAFAIPAKETWVLGQLATHFMLDKDLGSADTVAAVKSGELQFADMDNWENLFSFLDLAVEYGPEKPLEIDWETSENMLANGECAMIHMGDWCQSVLDSFNPDANLGFLPCPVGDGAEDCTLLSNCNWTYIVNKDSENLELAKEYCEYILSSEKGQWWMTEGIGAVPGCKTDMEVTGTLANDAKQYISEGLTDGWLHTNAPSGYTESCGPVLQSYMLGEMSADDVTQIFQNCWLAE